MLYYKDSKSQIDEIESKIQAEIPRFKFEYSTVGVVKSVTMSDFYKVVILDWIAGRLQIGPKLSPVNINNTVWITCDFVDDV